MHMSMHMSMHMPIHMSVHTSAHIHTGTHVGTRVYTHVYTHVDTRMQNCACTRQCPCLCRRVSVSMSPHKSRHLPAHVSEHMPMPVFVSPSIRHVHMPFIYTGCVARHLPHSTQGPRVYSDGLYSCGRVRGAAPSADVFRFRFLPVPLLTGASCSTGVSLGTDTQSLSFHSPIIAHTFQTGNYFC